MPLAIAIHPSLDALPPSARALFSSEDSLFLSAAWFALARTAMADTAAPAFAQLDFPRGPLVLPLARAGRRLAGLTSPYTCLFRPLAHPDLPPAAITALGHWLGRRSWRAGAIRLDAMPADWPGLPFLIRGARRFALTQAFDHFGAWTASVAGLDWPTYLARRPGALRETIRRKSRNAALTLRLGRDPADLAAYEAIHARSWKEPEPYPAFIPAFVAAMADAGLLRIGVAEHSGIPVAAQLWTVENGRATVHKLAHDEAHAKASPGTLLTAHCIERLLAEDRVMTLDFGRGDDGYKRLWAEHRAQRVGLVVTPPWTRDAAAILGRRVFALARRRPM